MKNVLKIHNCRRSFDFFIDDPAIVTMFRRIVNWEGFGVVPAKCTNYLLERFEE